MSKYYPSISHTILKEKYANIFKDKDLLWLINEIIDSTDGNTGIPIGNYLSQYSGNLYLSDFDHWMKEKMHVKHYHRYMDDVVVLSGNKNYLHWLRKEIDKYLKTKLRLQMKNNWQIFPTYIRGIDFLGYRTFLNYVLLRKRNCKRMKRKMNKLKTKLKKGKLLNFSEQCSINSYKGWIMHCNSFRLANKYIYPLQRKEVLVT